MVALKIVKNIFYAHLSFYRIYVSRSKTEIHLLYLKLKSFRYLFFFRMGQILKDDESVVIIIKTISVSLLVDHHEM